MGQAPRVVVTGLGCRTPLGDSTAQTWDGLKAGRAAIGEITTVPLYDLKVTIGGEIKTDVREWVARNRWLMLDRFSVLAIAAAGEAIADAGLEIDDTNATRIGAIIGVGVCGWQAIEDNYRRVVVGGARNANVFTVPRVMPSAPAGQVSMAYGLRGPVFGVTSACSSSNNAILTGANLIRSGQCDICLVGGTEAPLVYGILKAWEALRILAPDTCRPFSANRRGLVLAEAAGIIVLERADLARARGARVYAEYAGGGMSADAGDLVAPSDEGPAQAIRICLADGGLKPEDVDYINAHGTGTKVNDATETRVIRSVFGSHADKLSVSSTKSMIGHALGAAGAVEMIACIKAIEEGIVPPTINFDEADPECDLDVTPNVARTRTVDVAMSNAFAFGGLNAVVAVKRATD